MTLVPETDKALFEEYKKQHIKDFFEYSQKSNLPIPSAPIALRRQNLSIGASQAGTNPFHLRAVLMNFWLVY